MVWTASVRYNVVLLLISLLSLSYLHFQAHELTTQAVSGVNAATNGPTPAPSAPLSAPSIDSVTKEKKGKVRCRDGVQYLSTTFVIHSFCFLSIALFFINSFQNNGETKSFIL